MKLFSRVNVIGAIALSALALAGCDKTPQAVQEVPQVVALGCPVATGAEMQRIFQGVNGVDDENHPLNDHGVPVDANGNCMSTAPAPNVYQAQVAQVYQDQLRIRYGYTYFYQPSYVHVIVVPGVVYRANTVPTGRVILQTSRPAGATVVQSNTVTVRPGATQTVRPGATSAAPATTTVSPGATSTVKPGAPAATPAAPAATPATVAPAKAAAPSSIFNRAPAAAPAPAPAPAAAPARTPAQAPVYVAPARSAAPSTTFSRPSTSSFSSSSSSRRK